jgi:hypothetical protein
VRVINFNGAVKVDISTHLRMHREEVRALALEWAFYDHDGTDEAEQAILVVMWDRHESGAYNHHWPNPHRPGEYVSLLGYVRPYIRGIAKKEIDKYKHFFEVDKKDRPILVVAPNGDYCGIDHGDDDSCTNLEGLQEQAQEQGRDRVYLDLLYDSPWPGLKTPLEGMLSTNDQELAEKLMANLTDQELEVLMALVGPGKDGAWTDYSLVYRTEREAAKSLGMAWTTYWRKLGKARARVDELLGTLGLPGP